jgi:hypothetical protein
MDLNLTGTERQRDEYRWIVKQTGGRWWLAAEPCGARLKIVGPERNDLQMALNLRSRISRVQAQKLAEVMNARIANIELF